MSWSYSVVTLFVAVIVGMAVLIESGEPSTCGCAPNSTLLQCGTLCERSCDINGGQPRSCEQTCAPRNCYCDDGLARNADGNCVLPEDCCDSETEEYLLCGGSCPGTCGNSDPFQEPGCTVRCIPGCFCKKGLVRRTDGKCVKPENCSRTKCDPALNEEYKECGTACTNWCGVTLRGCTEHCVESCVCIGQRIRRKDGKCVSVQGECDFYCGPNEEYQVCGTICPQTCALILHQVKPHCFDICEPGCVCVGNLVRNDYGLCIPPELCSGVNRCGPNEIYYGATSSVCPTRTCDEYCYNEPPFGGRPQSCPADCRCKPGLLSNNEGCCVPTE